MRKIQNADLGRKSPGEFHASRKRPVVVVLDNIRSLNNIGSIFRSADAFLCEGIALCGITATPPHREIHKTALGAEDTVPWTYYPNTTEALAALKENGFRILAVEQTDLSVPLEKQKFSPEEKTAFVFGHEVDGVSEAALSYCDGSIEISQFGTKHSINVSVCAGIILWQHWLKTDAVNAGS